LRTDGDAGLLAEGATTINCIHTMIGGELVEHNLMSGYVQVAYIRRLRKTVYLKRMSRAVRDRLVRGNPLPAHIVRCDVRINGSDAWAFANTLSRRSPHIGKGGHILE